MPSGVMVVEGVDSVNVSQLQKSYQVVTEDITTGKRCMYRIRDEAVQRLFYLIFTYRGFVFKPVNKSFIPHHLSLNQAVLGYSWNSVLWSA
jgi:hypothetical protein